MEDDPEHANMTHFEGMETKIQLLRRRVQETENQLRDLKLELQQVEQEAEAGRQARMLQQGNGDTKYAIQPLDSLHLNEKENGIETGYNSVNGTSLVSAEKKRPLLADEYKRYGRQLIMREVGLHGQLQLKKAKVLIVGLGGLGCPAAVYLAGAGVGTLGLMDGDTVELSNLHRQVVHSTSRIGMSKVDSACEYLKALNPFVKCDRYNFHLSPERAIPIFEQYDLVLDCTDHPTSRYLISDACVLTGKALVSASALKTEGQLIVLNNPPRIPGDMFGGPCYRCVFPKPPPAGSVLSCGEGGILGPVVGVMGVLQALEAIKVLTTLPQMHSGSTMMSNGHKGDKVKSSMLMFSAFNNPQFRTVRLRSRRSNCSVCSAEASVTKQSLETRSLDYLAFCGANAPINVLSPESRISATEFTKLPSHSPKTLIDTRDETQFAICALPGSINVPWTGNSKTWLEKAEASGVLDDNGNQTYVVCRFGNDSQLAAKAILDWSKAPVDVKDIRGGLESWRKEVDAEWPEY